MTGRAAMLVVIAIARAAHAGDVVSTGPLAMHARADLVLGNDVTAELHLRAGAAKLVTNVGEITAPAGAGGELHATLRLPAQHFPQLAIVAALDDRGTIVDWLAIPLAGQASVKVKTAPLASVVVRIADRELAPVVADRAGVANVSIIVPPGIGDATAIATAPNGNRTEKALALGAHPFSRTLSVCTPGSERVSIVAVAADATPSQVAPRVTVSTGSIAALARRGPGVFEAAVRSEGDEVSVASTFAGDQAASTCMLELPPEAPNDARLVADRDGFVAGSGPMVVRAELAFPGKRHAVTPASTWTADFGAIRGEAWTIPDAFAGRHTARVRLVVSWPGGHLDRELVVRLAPAPAVRIVATSPARLLADGATSSEIRARVVDRFGNAVDARGLRAVGRGHLGELVVGADGTATAHYVTPRSRIAGDDPIELVDPATGLSDRIVVPLRSLPKQLVVSARAGYLSNLGRVSAPLVAVAVEARLPYLGDRLVAGGELGLYHAAFAATAMEPAEQIATRITAAPVLARLAYRAAFDRFDVWAGAGVGAIVVATRLVSPSAGDAGETSLHAAASAFAGTAVRVPWGVIVVEGGYLQATLSSGPVQGRLGGLEIAAGFGLEL